MPRFITPDLKATVAAMPVKMQGVIQRMELPMAEGLPQMPCTMAA